jgi:alkylresorcinol/alkylpyrone synthase
VMNNTYITQSKILGIATAVPPFQMKQSDVARVTKELFGTSFSDFERLQQIYGNAAINTRYSCVPISWYSEAHGFKDRNALFVKHAVNLLEEAATRALIQAGLTPADIDVVVSVSTSGIATPSLDALIIERMQLRRDVERLPIFGLGCAGGVVGLARAGQMASSRPGTNVLFLVVELCGLTFRRDDHSKSNVIATALFGDGAAAAIISTNHSSIMGGPKIRASGEHTWPGTLDVMGWNVEDDGFGVLFSQNIPTVIKNNYRKALDYFLSKNELSLDQIDRFAMHPGGARVVSALEEALDLEPNALTESRTVLSDFGNMSAVTVLFVLEQILSDNQPFHKILLSSLGPGFTAGFLVLEPS